jgi:hypothetical protein
MIRNLTRFFLFIEKMRIRHSTPKMLSFVTKSKAGSQNLTRLHTKSICNKNLYGVFIYVLLFNFFILTLKK